MLIARRAASVMAFCSAWRVTYLWWSWTIELCGRPAIKPLYPDTSMHCFCSPVQKRMHPMRKRPQFEWLAINIANAVKDSSQLGRVSLFNSTMLQIYFIQINLSDIIAFLKLRIELCNFSETEIVYPLKVFCNNILIDFFQYVAQRFPWVTLKVFGYLHTHGRTTTFFIQNGKNNLPH
jgi:hypothetical protein